MKKLLVFCLIIITGFSLVGCKKGSDAPAPAKTITIGVMPDVESIPFVIAEKNGYFEKEGVQVKLVAFKSAKDRDSALQSGQLDGVISDVLAVVFANEGGIGLRIVAKNEGNIELLAGKGSGINAVNDIKGKSLGISSNTIMEYTADQMLIAAGIGPSDVKKVAIPAIPTRFEMLQGGKVDSAIMPEPLAGLAVKNGARVLNSTDKMANKAGAIAFTVNSMRDNPEQIKAVFRAYNDGVDYLQKEPVSNYIDFLIQKQSFPAEVKDSFQLPQYTHAAPPSEKVVADVVQWMKEKQLIKGNYDYSSLVDAGALR